MSKQKKEIVVGSLVSVSNSIDGGRWLGLIVNQKAGQKWVEKDPCVEYTPSSESEEKFLLARVLGLKLTELALGKTGLPEREPSRMETVRWAFVQLNQAYVVADPDVESIENFLLQCQTCMGLGGMRGATFLHDVGLIAEYLRGVTRTRDQMGFFESQYFKMLEEVLPR